MNTYDMARLLRTYGLTSSHADRNEYLARERYIVDCVGPEDAYRTIAEAYAKPRLTDDERATLLKQEADEAAEVERNYQSAMARVRAARLAAQSPVGWAPHKTKQIGPSIYAGLRVRYEETRMARFDFSREQVRDVLLSAMSDFGLPNMLHRSPEEKEKVYDAAIALLTRDRVVVTTH